MDDQINSQLSESVEHYEDEQSKKTINTLMTSTNQENQQLLTEDTGLIRIQTPTNDSQKMLDVIIRKRRESCRAVAYFGYLIVAIGIAITLSSTYINILNTIRYVRFTSPCVINATAGKTSTL